MALTEDRIEYRVVVDGDWLHDDSQFFDWKTPAEARANVLKNRGHSVEIKTRHVITQYGDWE